jgi:hypothetical protein
MSDVERKLALERYKLLELTCKTVGSYDPYPRDQYAPLSACDLFGVYTDTQKY